ncbi:glycosyltransferase family 2 protein [Candidatus Pacearchaeota archaeon]|nr:glycosyltransferase family 2 protein [Candidatus Pacearchaeota archaeon]
MPTYNKEKLLPYVLYSLTKQKTDFEYQLCIVDDNSTIDPESIIKSYFHNVKYKRLDQHYSFDTMMSFIVDFVPEDTDIIVMQSADVVYMSDNILQTLVDNCLPDQASFCTVANVNKELTEKANNVNNFYGWLKLVNEDWQINPPTIRSGKVAIQNYFFLGAIRKKDMELLDDIKRPWCDIMLHYNMANYGIKAIYPDNIYGAHLWHEPSLVMCQNMDHCNLVCKLRYYFKGRFR